jgi:hypothetical protein
MSDKSTIEGTPDSATADEELRSRRDFLIGLGRWSKIVIGAAVLGGISAEVPKAEAAAWVNRRGVRGAAVVARPAGGAAVVARPVGGTAWVNHAGGGGGWVNRRGGGGAWVNRR